MSMDSPAGYTCCLNRFQPLFYPDTSSAIARQFLAILELIYRARLLMESSLSVSLQNTSRIRITRTFESERKILPSFQKIPGPIKHRKRNRESQQ